MRKLALTVLILAIILVAGCTQTAETPTKSPTGAAITEKIENAPNELKLNIGETAKTTKIQITVTDVKKADFYSYYSDILKDTKIEKAPQGKTFIIAEAEIMNINTSREYAGSGKFSIMDSQNFRYESEYYYGTDGLNSLKELYPNEKIKGKMIFEIPQGSTQLRLLYDFGTLFTDVKLANWNIPEMSVEKLESKRSAILEINKVDYSWYYYMGSGYITSIDYTVSNTGSVLIEPRFDISIDYGTINVYSEKGTYGGYYASLQPEDSISKTISLYQSVDYTGEYLVKVYLRDGDDSTILGSANKTILIG